MKKKLLLVSSWLFGTVLMIMFLVESLYVKPAPEPAHDLKNPEVLSETITAPNQLLYASIPSVDNKIKADIKTADARSEILRQYLKEHESPLYPEANLLVKVADENGFDFRWMVAIAQQESNLCKKIPDGSYNCWGWGIYCLDYDQVNQKCNQMKITKFDSFADAIVRIAPQFKEKFLSKGTSTQAHEVMGTYTPPSDGSWAFGVNQFFNDLE